MCWFRWRCVTSTPPLISEMRALCSSPRRFGVPEALEAVHVVRVGVRHVDRAVPRVHDHVEEDRADVGIVRRRSADASACRVRVDREHVVVGQAERTRLVWSTPFTSRQVVGPTRAAASRRPGARPACRPAGAAAAAAASAIGSGPGVGSRPCGSRRGLVAGVEHRRVHGQRRSGSRRARAACRRTGQDRERRAAQARAEAGRRRTPTRRCARRRA